MGLIETILAIVLCVFGIRFLFKGILNTGLFLLVLAIIGYSRIFSTYRYIPYTNYLTYALKGEFPSYSYRSAYNHNNSPYKITNKKNN